MNRSIRLKLLDQELSITRRPADSPIPEWATSGSFFSISRTGDELSIVSETEHVPALEKRSDGWKAFEVEGPLDFSEIGVIASISDCIAAAEISIFVLSTWDTDYVLVRADQVERACSALEGGGHTVRIGSEADATN